MIDRSNSFCLFVSLFVLNLSSTKDVGNFSMKKVVNRGNKKKMKGGSSIKSTMGLDSGFFFLGLFGFILLLGVVLVLALTQEIEEDGVLCSSSLLKPIQMEWRKVWIGGCAGSRWGCCPDYTTTKYDAEGSNCVDRDEEIPCAGSWFGCCSDGQTHKINPQGTNCP